MLCSLLLLALSATHVFAFPSMLSEAFISRRNAEHVSIDSPCPHMNELAKRQAPGVTPPFDPSQQYVSTTGEHAFVAPGPTDQRGPCLSFLSHRYLPLTNLWSGPGLNAMANHGYLPHNGVGSMQDFIDGTQAAFGMGKKVLPPSRYCC